MRSRNPRSAAVSMIFALAPLLAGVLSACEGDKVPASDACSSDAGCGEFDASDVPSDPGDPGIDPAGDRGPGDVVADGIPADTVADACVPDCAERLCGSDGCGGLCGSCKALEWCDDKYGVCNPIEGCREACAVGDCDTDPCGLACGDCPETESCVNRRCEPCPAECTGGCSKQVPCCVIQCTGRQCGDDGCGGVCGTCTDLSPTCNQWGLCGGSACDWATQQPTSWGPAAVVTSLQTPADAEVVKATCFDFTGDGLGDSGFKGLAGQVNGPFADAIAKGDITILAELAGVTDFANTPSLVLNGLAGISAVSPPVTGGDFQVRPESYVEATCRPVVTFPNATIASGLLTAGPTDIRILYAILPDLVVDWTMVQVQVKGEITSGDAETGFEIANGVVSGVILKKELSAVLDKMLDYCDAIPKESRPDFCAYLYISTSMGPTFFDLHDMGDGTFQAKSKELPGTAASACVLFQASKARILGFPSAP